MNNENKSYNDNDDDDIYIKNVSQSFVTNEL